MVRSKQPTTWNVTVSISVQGLDWKNWKQNEGARTKMIEVKTNKGHEFEWFRGWEGQTLEIWSRQMIKKPKKINVSNDMFSNGMWCRILNTKHGVQISYKTLRTQWLISICWALLLKLDNYIAYKAQTKNWRLVSRVV